MAEPLCLTKWKERGCTEREPGTQSREMPAIDVATVVTGTIINSSQYLPIMTVWSGRPQNNTMSELDQSYLPRCFIVEKMRATVGCGSCEWHSFAHSFIYQSAVLLPCAKPCAMSGVQTCFEDTFCPRGTTATMSGVGNQL